MAWAIWFVTTTTDISRSVVRSGVLPDPTDADDPAEDAVDTASDATLETAG
jgi:hypothetical protein